jgi:hypothetical protein
MAWIDTVPVQYDRTQLTVEGDVMKTEDAIDGGSDSGSSLSSPCRWSTL